MKSWSLIRFLLEAAFLVLVVAVAGVAGLALLWIGLAMFGAWLLVALVELFASGRSRRRRKPVAETSRASEPEPAPEPEPEPEGVQRSVVMAATPVTPEPPHEPAPEPVSVVSVALRDPSPRAWNLWELEQVAEEMDGDARAEERTLLLLHMRQYADPSGDLPLEFDSLVRDAFGAGLAELVT